MAESVVLVDEDDRAVGTAEKLSVHRSGALHRAFSVVLFDRVGRLLLQRRAEGKYHCAGLWSNSCCGHPRPGEPVREAATRRLAEELGVSCVLAPAGKVLYRADMPEGLIEHELDHLFVARFDGEPAPDPAEVSGWRWVSPAVLRSELDASPGAFTPWLRIVLAALPHPLPGGKTEGRKDAGTEGQIPQVATSELVEHRGEVQLRVEAPSLADLMAESARAVGELERQSIPVEDRTVRYEVVLTAPDLVSLLVDWLNELIYLSETGPWAPEQAEIHLASDREVRATVSGPRLAAPPSLVKAATLHRATVRQTTDGWLAEVVLDV